MHLVALGLNHNSASIELRELVAVSEVDLPAVLVKLSETGDIREAVVLSTCNRTELYVVSSGSQLLVRNLLTDLLASLHGLDADKLKSHIYAYYDDNAVKHLMSVASGLDSMMLGEYQIMSQVKSAYGAAQAQNMTDTTLNSLFQSALSVGKRVRTDTEISRGAFSVGAAAVEFATRIFGDNLATQSVLLLGAGQIGELTARHLQARGASNVYVANRTIERARALAAQLDDAEAIGMDDVSSHLVKANIVICSISSATPVLTLDMVKTAMRVRRNRPLYIVDIAVPRNVDPSVSSLENVFLYNIDDLSQVVKQAHSARLVEIRKAQQIVGEATSEYMRWRQTRDATPLIIAVRERLESLRLDEMAKLRAKMPHLEDRELRAIEQSLMSYSNKIAHDAIIAIKESSTRQDPTGYARIDAIKSAFGLSEKIDK